MRRVNAWPRWLCYKRRIDCQGRSVGLKPRGLQASLSTYPEKTSQSMSLKVVVSHVQSIKYWVGKFETVRNPLTGTTSEYSAWVWMQRNYKRVTTPVSEVRTLQTYNTDAEVFDNKAHTLLRGRVLLEVCHRCSSAR